MSFKSGDGLDKRTIVPGGKYAPYCSTCHQASENWNLSQLRGIIGKDGETYSVIWNSTAKRKHSTEFMSAETELDSASLPPEFALRALLYFDVLQELLGKQA